jgi:dTDP-glucose 4,6-dehydratase
MSQRTISNILVTGGCGFIGSAFIRRLFQKATFSGTVTNLDKLTYAGNHENVDGYVDLARYEFVRGDIADENLVESICNRQSIDIVVHFAAESHVDRSINGPLAFVNTNIVGTVHLLEVLRRQKHIHFHHVSTDEVFGSLGPTGAFSETTPYDPKSPYSGSKAASDHFVRAYGHTYDLSITISNCSNNYGPYQFPEKLIPLMILNLLERKPLPIYGDGSNIRDWLHVDDHVDAIWAIINQGNSGQTYNIGGNSERTNLELVDKLIEIVAQETGRNPSELVNLKTFVKDRPGHDQRYAIDATKIREELGFSPRYVVDDGLRETVRWYLKNGYWITRVRTGEYRLWIEKNYGERNRG